MDSLKQFIINVFSTKSVGIFVYILTAIAITLILSGRYYFHTSIIENNVSKRDIYANRTIKIIDNEKTQKLKQDIAQKISPIMVPIQDDFIRKNLDKNIDAIDIIRDKKIPLTDKRDELLSYFNINDEKSPNVSDVDRLLEMSNSHFDKIKTSSRDILYSILDKGINETQINENFDQIVRDNNKKYYSIADIETITFLLKEIIAPNVIVDDEATEVSKKSALNSVKPVEVTFLDGTKIVSAGQPVSKLQKDALKQCGYNVVQLNLSGILGIFVLVVVGLFACAYHIEVYEPKFKRKSYYCLISLLMILLATCATILPPYNDYILFLPLAAFTMMIAIFLNYKTSMISSIAILCAIALSLQMYSDMAVIMLFGIFATAFTVDSVEYTSRMELTKVGLMTSLVYIVTLVGTFFLNYNLADLSYQTLGEDFIILTLNGFFSSIIALGLIPVLESIFNISTPYGLMELANTNHPLLQKLQEKAPGTHHHSQMVAILAEAAAEAVNANPILTRIGALYHDVGKINRPLFFVENQSYYGIENPHDQFSPKFSKMVITTHPRDGVDIAKEYKISPSIYPYILEHHGDSIASYFYNEAIKQEGKENVSEDEYRYNAPRPSSKESAIIMLADSVESAVRSLKNATFEEIDAKVDAIIRGKLLDGQLSDSPLTLKDLKTIAATFNRVLKGMHHQRIKYHEDMENIQKKVSEHEELNGEN